MSMDLGQKRKGFMKVKVPSFGSRVSKSPSVPLHPHSSKVNPSNIQYNTCSVDYHAKQDVAPKPMKMTFVVPVNSDERVINRDTYYGAIADEYVNMKASNYIMSVKERFRIETLNSERRASQEITS